MISPRLRIENQPELHVTRLVRASLRKRPNGRRSGRLRLRHGVVVDYRLDVDVDLGTGTLETRLESAPRFSSPLRLVHSDSAAGPRWSALCPRWCGETRQCKKRVELIYWPLHWSTPEWTRFCLPGHCASCCGVYVASQARHQEVTNLASAIRRRYYEPVKAAIEKGGLHAIHARMAMEHEGVSGRFMTANHRTHTWAPCPRSKP